MQGINGPTGKAGHAYEGISLIGRVVAVYGVDAGGVGRAPFYDIDVYLPGRQTIELRRISPDMGRPWARAGLDTQTVQVNSFCRADFVGDRLVVDVREFAAFFEQDCTE